jgi:hypothetical protein
LHDDRPMIELFVDKVHGASGDSDPIGESLTLRVETGKGGQQRRVDVENALREGAHKLHRQQSHVASETDEINLVRLQTGDDLGIVLGALPSSRLNHLGRESCTPGSRNSGRIAPVGDYNGNLHTGQAPLRDSLGDGKKVGAPAGKQDSQTMGPEPLFTHV